MKSIEKIKTQKIIDKILNGEFDENDVDSLFMKLRAYSSNFDIFREMADFVAHNNERDRGVINSSMETMYLRMKYWARYNDENRENKSPLDITKPFPKWIKQLFILQVGKKNNDVLREKFNTTKERLISRIKKSFKDINNSNNTVLRENKKIPKTFELINYLMSYVHATETFSQDDLIDEVIGVIEKNDLIIDAKKFKKQSNCFTLFTLLLIHNTEFNIKADKKVYCKVTTENGVIGKEITNIGEEANKIDNKSHFGNLSIIGEVPMITGNGKNLTIAHPIMTTNLPVEIYCNENMFQTEYGNKEHSKKLVKKLYISDNIQMVTPCSLANI